MKFEIRTDLAVERREAFGDQAGKLSGVSAKEWYKKDSQVRITQVEVLNETGEKAMGKAKGMYMTLEAGQMAKKDQGLSEQ